MDKFEVLVAAGSIKGLKRKLVVIAAYLPPSYKRQRGEAALNYIEEVVIEVKRCFKDPYVAIMGDFNQLKMEQPLSNFLDVSEVPVGPTRGTRRIDRIFVNVGQSITESGTLEPLETEGEESTVSDHRIAFCRLELNRREAFRWETYSYRHYNEEWVVMHNWDAVLSASTSNLKAEEYQRTIMAAIERLFPLKTVRRKSTDPPWMDKKTAKMVEDRRRLFVEEGGRTEVWKAEKKRTEKTIMVRKRIFFDPQKEHLLASDANRNFYTHVRNFGVAERPKLFDV